jgi:hypothetical protein
MSGFAACAKYDSLAYSVSALSDALVNSALPEGFQKADDEFSAHSMAYFPNTKRHGKRCV